MSDDGAAAKRPSWAPTPPTPPTPVAPPSWLAQGGGGEPDTAPDAPADTDSSDAAPDTTPIESVAPVAPAAYFSDVGYRSTFVSSAADAAPEARAAGPRRAPSDVVAAQRAGVGDPYAPRPAASSRPASSGRRVITRRSVGVIVAAVVVLVAWVIPALHGIATSGSGGGADTSALPASGSYDPTRLRTMLDQLMAVNRSLPDHVGAPRPKDAARASALAHRIEAWRSSHTLAPADARLARAGAAFAKALGLWLAHPEADAAYQAYLAAWRRWDAADPTWQSK